jgi:methionine--tRNA ligase beta chain
MHSMEKIKDQINFEDFAKIDIRVAKIIDAQEIPESEKLIKLELEVGEETRQVLAGIKKWYSPDELIGLKTIYLANLKPRKIMGVESQGMLMAIDSPDDEKPILFKLNEDVNTGDFVC